MGHFFFKLVFRHELENASEAKERQDEILLTQHADIVIIQDKGRTKILIEENLIDESKVAFLQVSPRNSKPIKSDYLRRKFHIPLDKKIILHSGSF